MTQSASFNEISVISLCISGTSSVNSNVNSVGENLKDVSGTPSMSKS